MFSFSQPSQASASIQSMSMSPAEPSGSSSMDDVALGCECADPALQIAMWGQEAEPVQAAASSS